MDILQDLMHLLNIMTLSPGTQHLDAFIAAGLIPALVALLGRWEAFKAAFHGGGSNPVALIWMVPLAEAVRFVISLAERSPAARRQLRDAGAAPALQLIGDDRDARQITGALCQSALRHLG